MKKPKLLIFASGTLEGGGSGFEKLVEASRNGTLSANIVGVVSSHLDGRVRQRAESLGIPFGLLSSPWTAERYQQIVETFGTQFVTLSGWLKVVSGLDPRTTFNIHPGPLPLFGGKGMYGHHVHEAVLKAYKSGLVHCSAVSMHFVTEQYDKGPVFFRKIVEIKPDDTPETLGKRVNEAEHRWQPIITNLVVNGEISWDGENPKSLFGPEKFICQDP